MTPLSFSDFRRAVLDEFPALHEAFAGDDELPYLQVGAFALFTQRAKGQADWDCYRRCVRLADRLLARAAPDLENALYVAYLEHLDFEGPRGSTAWRLLTPALQAAWQRIRNYNEAIASRPGKRKNRRP
jgi:hypothetical protein